MELEGQWWRGQLAADIHQALRYKVTPTSDLPIPALVLPGKANWVLDSTLQGKEGECAFSSGLINLFLPWAASEEPVTGEQWGVVVGRRKVENDVPMLPGGAWI